MLGMNPSLTIRVPGRPESWGIITSVRGKHASIALNAKSKEYQKRIAASAHNAAPGSVINVPIRIDYVLVFPRLKRHKAPGRHRHAVSPDFDRVLRNINDGLQRDARGRSRPSRTPSDGWGGFLTDDSLICGGSFECYYAAEDEAPHTLITISPIGEP